MKEMVNNILLFVRNPMLALSPFVLDLYQYLYATLFLSLNLLGPWFYLVPLFYTLIFFVLFFICILKLF
jgi:hypothetical protein